MSLTKKRREDKEQYELALKRFEVLASVSTSPVVASGGWPKLYYVMIRRYGADKYVHSVLAINEYGEIEDIGKYVHYLTGLKMLPNSYQIVSRYASDITEHVNRALEKEGWSRETFRGVAL